MSSIGAGYLPSVIRRVKYYKDLADKAFDQLEDSDFNFQPSTESNTIAVIIQHMAGNMLSRWTNFLTEDGEKEWRLRDDEFEAHSYSREKLLDIWQQGWDCFLGALESLKEEDLLKTIYIRKEAMTAMDAVNRQLAHYPHHVGQILYIGKLLKNEEWKSLSIPKRKDR